ncbi:FG-GAP-like repeat-containing protein [Aquimarina mytili]|uniref:VCBS repeat-containing protein n=1 Tax=Aquimarina mytili TaxID=874423 RepID=A0A937A1D4_9FLAO|nr:FG-GAP-like repeat-containing protein [Aquimarina mytili]MBL0685680.1 VCBS repeat-containing protein [Aquimarina mytili]
MKKLLLFSVSLLTFCVYSQTFTELNTANLTDLFLSSAAWGDYDNDGDLDVLLTGLDSYASNRRYSKIYTNNGGTFTELTSANLPGADNGAVAWGDYDNDGDLDVLLAGGLFAITKIYTNTNGTFTELTTANLPGTAGGSVAWGDYDNDGDLDILMTGGTSKIYTNNAGVFTELTTANLLDLDDSSAAWGDYDNDGDLDVLLTGYTGSADVSKIYTNNNGVFEELLTANLIGVSYSSVAWGDYDNDGDLDILMTGFTGSTTVSKIYTNTAGTFTELVTANLPNIQHSSVAWGDYDNDGDLDILLTGVNGSTRITRIYTNTAGTFSELVSANLLGGQYGSAVWGDYDNDNDLDILVSGIAGDDTNFSKIYTNNIVTPNTPPTAPTNPTAVVNGNEVTLSWTASTDAETPSNGLSYNVYIKDALTSSAYSVSPMAQENDGWRKLPAMGNAGQSTSRKYIFPPVCTANYTFKVQAIDHSFAGSAFSAEGSFSTVDTTNPTIVTQDITVQLDSSGNASITTTDIDNGSSDNCGIQSMSLDTTTFDCTHIGTNTVTLTVTDIYGNSDTQNATVTIEDNELPMVITQNITLQLDTSGNASITPAQIDNGSSDNCGIQSTSLDMTAFNSTHVGANTVTLTVTDVNGNSNSRTATVTVQNIFEELTTTNIPDVFQSDLAWGDYDNDGDLDLLVTGKKSISVFIDPISKIYTNNGGAFTELASANLEGVQSGSVEWGDYDNDGDLDILLTGLGVGDVNVAKIYTNNGGTFTELATANLQGIAYGDVAWGDYDNDGDLDIALSGGRISKIYTNNEGIFTELASANLPGLFSGALAWGDYDNDGDLDILLTGYTGSLDISKIYTNTNGVFTELTSASLTGVSYSSAAWGDHDNDGDLDILLSGYTGSAWVSKIYTNTAGSFTELATANLLGVQEGSAAWGDYDNDGDLDVLITGTGGGASTRIYTNTAGVFTHLITGNLPNITVSDAVWGDYDNDGDLDIAMAGVTTSSFTSKIFTNNSTIANTAPTAPTDPVAVVNGDEVTLSWTASTDAETPSSGLSYNVYIKDASTSSAYEVSPMAQENNGWRKLPAMGNSQQNTSYRYKLSSACTTNYTFKVQAIDHSFAGSAFSSEGSFSTVDATLPTVVTQDITIQLNASGNASITPAQIDNGSSDNCGIQSMSLDITSFDCMNIGTNTVTLTVTDVNGNSDTNTAIVTVEDNINPILVTQNITVQLDASGNANITPNQIDNGSSDNCGIHSMSLDTTSFDCTNIGTNTVTLTVTDVNGNSDTQTATVTIEDKIVPTVVTQDITVQLNASGSVTITPAQIDNGSSDACGIQSMSLDVTSFDCTHVGTNTVTLTVTDVNGNSDTQTATVTLEDKIVPTVVTQNITVQLDASGSVTITPTQIDNGSSDNCGIQTMSLDTTTFDDTNLGANIVTLTVTDVHGNVSQQTATVTVHLDCLIDELLDNNFQLQVSNETCSDKNNGVLRISTIEDFNYIATLNGETYAFTDNLIVTDLTPGVYPICISIEGIKGCEKCYEFVIEEAPVLEGKTTMDKSNNTVAVDIQSGTAPYTVTLNNKVVGEYHTNSFAIDAKNGGAVEIFSSKAACQGKLSMTLDELANINAYPNPTRTNITLSIPNAISDTIAVEVHNALGMIISSGVYDIIANKVELPMQALPTGIYFVTINQGTLKTLRIVKQ